MKNCAKIFFVAAALAVSCGKEYEPDEGPVSKDIEGVEIAHGEIILGDKLEDPYTVANMTKALESVYPTKAGSVEIAETDLYVRFLPETDEQYDLLESLCPDMLDHPVDYQIKREGDWYHDPDIPEEKLTWQYAVIAKDFVFPQGIKYEILDRCYISENDVVTRAAFPDIDWQEVERESFRLTGNEDLIAPVSKAGGSQPSGRITIVDDMYDPEPIGVKCVTVSCNVFVKFCHAYTDEEGNYTMSKSFTGNPRYRLLFKNKKGFGTGFNLVLIPASFSTLGKHSPEGVDCEIDKESNRALFSRSVVNNAAYDYFESCNDGDISMTPPPSNLRIWLFQHLEASSAVMLQQGAFIDGSLLADYLGEYVSLAKMFLPDITLGLKNCGDYASIYGVATHEIAHASHYAVVGNKFWDKLIKFVITSFVTSGWVVYGAGTEADHGYCEVAEMWAYYMQTKVYRERYPDQARSFGTSYWFSPQIFTYLDERGLDRFKIFKSLSEDVIDIEVLQKRMLSLYPEYKATINQAFDRYK